MRGVVRLASRDALTIPGLERQGEPCYGDLVRTGPWGRPCGQGGSLTWGPPAAHPYLSPPAPISYGPPQDSQQANEPEEHAVLEARPWGWVPWGGMWGLGGKDTGPRPRGCTSLCAPCLLLTLSAPKWKEPSAGPSPPSMAMLASRASSVSSCVCFLTGAFSR